MDILDKQMKQKQFFKTIFGVAVGEGNNLLNNQYIRIYQSNKTDNIDYGKIINKVEFFNNIDDLVQYCSINTKNMNTYFNLSLTNGKSGQTEDLKERHVLSWDFDKKHLGEDFSHIDIIENFKNLNLWYHCLVDSGHGYHTYICIEPTDDIDKVVEVTKAIGNRISADKDAMKPTQLLRVPYTFNIKNKIKQVNIINLYPKDTIKRYNINDLYNRFCTTEQSKSIEDKAIKYTLNNTNLQPCIVDILQSGSKDGSKNYDLQKIVVSLRSRNKKISEILYTCKEWNSKSENKFSDNELEYQVNYMYENLRIAEFKCQGCKYNLNCWNRIESDFNYGEGEILLSMSETHTKTLKKSNRKGAKCMESNDLLVYCILKNHSDGLYREELIKEMTYKNKCLFSDKTLTKALTNLEENGFIEVSGKPKLYKIKDIRTKSELVYDIGYGAAYECVKGNISTEELRLYNYMRYLHHKQQREEPGALKGNLLQVNQIKLAEDLGVTQGRISQMIDNLLQEKLLSIWYRQKSKNNGFEYNIYRLNY